MSERDLFIAALQKDDPAERAAYLADASDNDVELRRRVERLLRLHADAGSFLDQPAGEPGETVDPAPGGPDGAPGQADPERTRDEPPPPGEGVGTFIGPYKLMQKLGEGGMGVVWVAEQHEPVKRRVALKVIKPGKAVDDDTLAVGGRGHGPRSTYPLSISSRIPRKGVLRQAPHRTPAQSWPPTDPFVYRLYEVVLLYGPVFKDVAHELFGDGIMSAIDMAVNIRKVEDPPGVPRMLLSLDGKWLKYKKF